MWTTWLPAGGWTGLLLTLFLIISAAEDRFIPVIFGSVLGAVTSFLFMIYLLRTLKI